MTLDLFFECDGGHDETLLASGSRDHSIKLWDAHTGALRDTLLGHTGDVIALLGTTSAEDLSMSEYAVTIEGVSTAEITESQVVPKLDLERELAVQGACLEAAEAGLLHSAHDCSDGGLAITLAELCFSSLGREAVGAEVNLAARLQTIAEPGHIVISYETYALVRDIVAARALPQIAVKGISRTVIPYVVEGVLDETGRKIVIFSEHMTGLDFYLDPRAVDAAARECIRETLKNAIAALEARDGDVRAEAARTEQAPSPTIAND